jgi:hypothetical protein
MDSTPKKSARLVAQRAAAAACQSASPLQVTAAAPLWRALSTESAIWLLMPSASRTLERNGLATHRDRGNQSSS